MDEMEDNLFESEQAPRLWVSVLPTYASSVDSCIRIIECNSTLYVGAMRKQNGGPIPCIHCSFAKYLL